LAAAVAGALGLWATVLAEGTAVTGYLTIPSVYVLGLGIWDMHLQSVRRGDRRCHAGRGRQRQRLASAIGAAIVTSIYFKVNAAHAGVTAMAVSSITLAVTIVSCLGLVWLLPRKAAEG
jgi:hypothetical protein